MIILKIVRIKKGVSQWDLSQETGIPNYRISLIENGRVQPRLGEVEALAKALGTTVKAITDKGEDLVSEASVIQK